MTESPPVISSESPSAVPSESPLAISSGRDNCGACGAPLAPDQRYCVECGQRRGSSRVPFMEKFVAPAQASAAAASKGAASGGGRRLPRLSANAALIAGIGTLILAMGVGVLIGRTATSEKSSSPPVRVTLGGTTGASTGTTTGATEPGTSTETSGTGTSGETGAKSPSSKASSKAASKTPAKSAKPKVKVVKIGSKGNGPGYNKKKEFTGNFFGEEK